MQSPRSEPSTTRLPTATAQELLESLFWPTLPRAATEHPDACQSRCRTPASFALPDCGLELCHGSSCLFLRYFGIFPKLSIQVPIIQPNHIQKAVEAVMRSEEHTSEL